jgi:hypothetical protein
VETQQNIHTDVFIWQKMNFRIKYKELQKQTSPIEQQVEQLKQELEKLKYSVQSQPVWQEIASLQSTVGLLRDIQFKQAIEKRRKAKGRRLGLGDSLTKYQFSITKPKRRKETKKELLLPSGKLVTNEEAILRHVKSFYQKFYAIEPLDSTEQQEAVDKLLLHMRSRLSDDQNRSIERVLDEQEVLNTIKQLEANKIPGLDGLTAELYKICWQFMNPEIILLLQEFWDTVELYKEFLKGVRKLIPKNWISAG